MAASLLISLHRKATLLKKGRLVAGIQFHSKRLTIENAGKGIRRALTLLKSGSAVPQDTLEGIVINQEGLESLATYFYCIRRLELIGALCYTVAAGSKYLATFSAFSPNFRPRHDIVRFNRSYRLSRFAYLRRDGDQMVLESPVSHSIALIQDPITFQFLLKLTRMPATMEDLQKEFHRVGKQTVETLMNLLLRHQFLEDPKESSLHHWEFHDLLFHSESRYGRRMKPYGGTYHRMGKSEPLPALKPAPQGEKVTLWKPERKRLKKKETSFSAVLEKRQSIREYDERRPITAKQLGEFLYRVDRVKKISPKNSAKRMFYEVALRPYPGGGGCYELEFYLIIRSCNGILPGLYYYDPKNHYLCKISTPSTATDQLLQDALNANGSSLPQVLICFAARFERVSWKYESIVYATILKNVGVLYQTMYLVATEMGLAPCALGCGNSDLFAQAAGSDYYAETSVGEFMLGSRKRNES